MRQRSLVQVDFSRNDFRTSSIKKYLAVSAKPVRIVLKLLVDFLQYLNVVSLWIYHFLKTKLWKIKTERMESLLQ